jgi:hypothetical protein
MKIYTIILFLLITTPQNISAQGKTELFASSSSNEALVNAVNLYKNAIGRNSRINIGSYYFDRNWGTDGHPFFLENYWESGTVMFEGQHYDSIEMRYDIYNDLLLVKYIDKEGRVTPIQLYNSKVDEFRIMGHHFVRLKEDTLSGFKTGFFDLLQDGETAKVLAKRKKEINRSVNSSDQVKEYLQKDKYYIMINQDYYDVNGKKSIIKVLSDRKSELKIFLKKNKSRFRKNEERQLIEVVQYYNSIVSNKGS